MTPLERLLSAWDWEPSVVAGCAALAIGYCVLMRGRFSRKALYFLGGVGILLLDLVSPLDPLADGYLFSAHMLQHFVLALIVPPLLLLGLPTTGDGEPLPHGRGSQPSRARQQAVKWSFQPLTSLRGIGQPPVSWLLGVGTMAVWHVPLLFNAALASEPLHIFQHLTFLAAGTIFWWPILAPMEEAHLSTFGSVSYLFTACLGCSLLGAALTFSPAGIYPAYLHPADSLGILPLIRGRWGLDSAADMQLGGLLMWVPGCFVYLSGILGVLARWYASPDSAPEGDFHYES